MQPKRKPTNEPGSVEFEKKTPRLRRAEDRPEEMTEIGRKVGEGSGSEAPADRTVGEHEELRRKAE